MIQIKRYFKRSTPIKRMGALWLLMAIASIILAMRLIHLQVFHRDFLHKQGNARSLHVINTPSYRGMITDRRESPLAISTPVMAVFVEPKHFHPSNAQLKQLADILNIPLDTLIQKTAQKKSRAFIYLKRTITPDVAAQLKLLKIPGVGLMREYKRYYPGSKETAQLIGYTDIDDQGQAGLELQYNEHLKSISGKKRVLEDRVGHFLKDVDNIRSPKEGQNLTLSLDLRIQTLALRELETALARYQAKSGTVVMLDVNTGEVLAMVSAPSFNPNNLAERKGHAVRNKALTDQIEPGSTVKPFTMAFALASGSCALDTVIDTSPGFLKIGKFTIRDGRNYGEITLQQVLAKSSNIGISKAIFPLPEAEMLELYANLGFGNTTLNFPGENIGKLPIPANHPFIYATHAFGYGLNVNALQIAHAYATLATRGLQRPVSLLKIDPPASSSSNYSHLKQVIPQEAAEGVVTMLTEMIQASHIPGYLTAGKTGTVRVVGPKGYDAKRHVALFAGFTPVNNPRLATVVIIEEPDEKAYYGGQVAAPVYAKIVGGALHMLNIPPEQKI